MMFGLYALIQMLRAAVLHVPKDHVTVQSTLNAAQSGDFALLSFGQYDMAMASSRAMPQDQRIALDGQCGATLRQFTFLHPYITVQNVSFTGVLQAHSRFVYFDCRGNYGVLSNCVLDAGKALKVCATFMGITMVSVMGDSTRITRNFGHDGGAVDFFRLFGRNNYVVEGIGNHTDFI